MSDDDKKPDVAKAAQKFYADFFLRSRDRDAEGNVALPAVDAELLKRVQELMTLESQARRKKIFADAEQKIAAVALEARREMENPAEGPGAAGLPIPPAPPRAGEVLVGLFCKRDMREAVLGDLDEKFAELAERRGPRIATVWYWGQAARSVLFFAVRWGRRVLELEAILKRIL